MFGGINPRRAPVPWLPLPFLLSGPLALAAAHLLLATHAAAVIGSYRGTTTVAVTVALFGVVLAVLLPHRRSSRAPEHQAARTARATQEIGD